TIAVVPLMNLDKNGSMRWLGVGIQESITWHLKRLKNVFPYELKDLVEATQKNPEKLTSARLEDHYSMGRRLGLDILIGGTYHRTDAQLNIELYAIDVTQKRVIARREFVTSPSRFPHDTFEALLSLGLFEP